MKTQNELESEVNLFLFSAGPYAEQKTFPQFVERIEEIRAAADQAFRATLQKEQPPRAVEEGGRESADS